MDQRVSRYLNDLIERGHFDVSELARWAGCSEGHIYKSRNGETMLGADKLIRLSRKLCRHGHTGLAKIFLTEDYQVIERGEGRANGRIEDDVTEAVAALGHLKDAVEDGDLEAAREALADYEQQGEDLKAELDRILSHATPNGA